MKGKARQGGARQRLFMAAIDVFNKQGFAAASTKQIIQKAKIIKPDDPLKLCLRLIGIIHVQVLMLIKGPKYLPRSQPKEIVDTFINGLQPG